MGVRRLKQFIRNTVKMCLYPEPLVGLIYLPHYISHFARYRKREKHLKLSLADIQPCLGDWKSFTPFDAHYFYQGAWLARELSRSNPGKHVDIGSSVLTLSVLSAFVPTIFLDYRPLQVSLSGLISIAGDIKCLPFPDSSLHSVSSMHVIEHIGLGRYGDALDPEGTYKAAQELQRVVRAGGRLFVSLPVGQERICFNAHRIHDPKKVIEMFPQMRLEKYCLIDDAGRLWESTDPGRADIDYGCGLFVFEKRR